MMMMMMVVVIHKFTSYTLLNFDNITKSNISFVVCSVYSVKLVAKLFSLPSSWISTTTFYPSRSLILIQILFRSIT